MKRLTLLLLFLLVITILNIQGQGGLLVPGTKNLIIKEWSVNDGLASNSVRKIAKTRKGYIFIATYDGISLFDGKKFINYNSNNVPELKSNNIHDFCVDKDSVIWIATHRGIVAFDGNEFFTPDELKSTQNYSIQSINIDNKGVLWIGTTSEGLFKYNGEQLSKIEQLKDLDKSIISLLFPDNKGNMWIGTEKGDLYKYNGTTFITIHKSDMNNGIVAAIQDSEGNYFFGTRNGLYTYKNDSIILVNNDINFINNIRLDSNGKLWVATNSGIYLYNKANQQFISVFRDKTLNNQILQTIYFDQEDIIWIGSYRKGLMQIRVGAFHNYPFSSPGIDEIPSALAEVNDSTLWIGTDEGDVYELIHGKYKKINFFTDLSNSKIKCIYIDSKKNRWICSYNGLIKWTNGIEQHLSIKSGFTDNTIRGIVETKDGKYWVATRQSGLYLMKENFEIVKVLNTSNGLSSNFVMSLVKGKKDKFYVSTKNGLDVIENEQIVEHYDMNNGLPDDMIFNVYEDADNIVWIATLKGLSRIEKNQITNYSKKSGLIDERIFDVTEDNYGFMWFPVINGLIRIKKSELNDYSRKKNKTITSVIYDKSDGIHDQQYVTASKILKTKSGNIVFNTISGVSILHPDLANTLKSNQALFINSVQTNVDKRFFENDYIEIPSSSRYLQINYSYLDFINPDKVEFRYMLKPFDNEWQNAGNERFTKYTNLPPGKYQFVVQAMIKSHVGEIIQAKADIVIKPAFYESGWFTFFIGTVILLIIWFVYVYRVRVIKRQKGQLEKEVKERTNKIIQQKEAIEKHIEELEIQKAEIAAKNEEIIMARNDIEQAYINLKLLSELGREITSSLSEEDILNILYSNINTLMDTDLLSIAYYHSKTKLLRFNSTIFKGRKIQTIEKLINSRNCVISYAVEEGLDVFSNNFYNDFSQFKYSFPDIDSLKKLTSVIIIPIRLKKSIIGVFTVQSFRKDAYSDYHFNLIESLVVYIGIAIENAKTYRKIQKQKDELQEVNTAKDKMFSLIGHDLRGPVGTIKSFLDLIIENPEMTNAENTLHILKTMQESLGSAYTLLDNLLVWARNQRGQIEYNPTRFFIKQPIDESINLVAEGARNKDITIETKFNYNAPVFADQNMITTVLRNLISNAIKFTPRKGKIEIITSKKVIETAEKLKEQIEIRVVDNGIGISKENIDKILKVNELFSTPGTDKEQGSGLGIGICIDFLNIHKQHLLVFNNTELGEKKGSTFMFYLDETS